MKNLSVSIEKVENGYLIHLLVDLKTTKTWIASSFWDMRDIIEEAFKTLADTPYPPLTQEKIPNDDIPF